MQGSLTESMSLIPSRQDRIFLAASPTQFHHLGGYIHLRQCKQDIKAISHSRGRRTWAGSHCFRPTKPHTGLQVPAGRNVCETPPMDTDRYNGDLQQKSVVISV